jgi:hypothetical protein
MTRPRWRESVGYGGVAFVFLVAFPRLAYRLRWPTRLSPRGVVTYVAFNTLLRFALWVWAPRFLSRVTDDQAQARKELRQQLGREPTEDEVFAHVGGVACRR